MIMQTHHMITLSFTAYRALSKTNDFLFRIYYTNGQWQKNLQNG